MTAGKARTPGDLRGPGRAFWRVSVADYDLSDSELQILKATCRLLDEAALLEASIDADGVVVAGSTGQLRTNPALGEARQHRMAIGRLLAQLALPGPEDHSAVLTPLQARSRKANNTRWGRDPRGKTA